jgi:hypothetical protein
MRIVKCAEFILTFVAFFVTFYFFFFLRATDQTTLPIIGLHGSNNAIWWKEVSLGGLNAGKKYVTVVISWKPAQLLDPHGKSKGLGKIQPKRKLQITF